MVLMKDPNRGKHASTLDRSFTARAWTTALVAAILLAWTGLPGAAAAKSSIKTPHQQAKAMTKIRMTIDGTAITMAFEDNATTRAFLLLLPMTLTLEDFKKTEKVSDLPKELSTEGAPYGIDPSIGDITYYAPWGNLAFFYRDFGYSRGLVRLGRIESGIEVLSQSCPLTAIIERVN